MNVGQCIRSQCCRIWSNHKSLLLANSSADRACLITWPKLNNEECCLWTRNTPAFGKPSPFLFSSLGSAYSICWSLESSRATLLKLLLSFKSTQTQLCKNCTTKHLIWDRRLFLQYSMLMAYVWLCQFVVNIYIFIRIYLLKREIKIT